MLRPEKNRETRRAAYGHGSLQGLREELQLRGEWLLPSCGAYNRPPRRETVEADGTVHHLDDRAAPTGRMPGGGGKVCFEEKTCYEEQARGGRVRRAPEKPRRKTGGQPLFAKLVTAVIIAIAVGMIVSVLRMIIASSVWDHAQSTPDYSWGEDWDRRRLGRSDWSDWDEGNTGPDENRPACLARRCPMTRAGPPRRTGRIFSTAAAGAGRIPDRHIRRVDAYTRSGDAM